MSRFHWYWQPKAPNGHSDVAAEPFDRAEILNDHFKSVFTLEDQHSVPDMGISPYPSILVLKLLGKE